ncbi:Dynein heavy chain 10, axonemal [Perkinsus chesapeaki]|uniref:Dynein heavy chain 10, axonemal n=1 Tax=Perkinsus chesapeaki TaxID=330153 RepID=A0A7J6M875_PERCH|nr:Dynein heavy chain 10, axonemal [Perkinsus chesapeaki]
MTVAPPSVSNDPRALWLSKKVKEVVGVTDAEWKKMLSQDGSEGKIIDWLEDVGKQGDLLVFYETPDKVTGERLLRVSAGVHGDVSRELSSCLHGGMYFIKTLPGRIDTTGKEISTAMLDGCTFGMLNGDSRALSDVQGVMEHLLLPAIEYKPPRSVAHAGRNRSSLTESLRSSRRLSVPQVGTAEISSVGSATDGDDGESLTEMSEASEKSVESEANADEEDENGRLVQLGGEVKEDVMMNANKFNQHLGQVTNQVYGSSIINIPEGIDFIGLMNKLDDDVSPDKVIEYEKEIKGCIDVIEGWGSRISDLLESESAISGSADQHPMAEILFWRDRSGRLSSLFEQFQLGSCQQVIGVVEKYVECCGGLSESEERVGRVLGIFKEKRTVLHKLLLEAKDNVKFLMTLERHLKKLTNGGMSEITETLPNLLNALRMVWIVSRYYNTDERMEPLLTKIGEQLANRVDKQISVRALLRRSPVRAGAIVKECKIALDEWERNYMLTRARIEESGSDHRWEFDRIKLFKRTKYMAKVCGDLMEIMKVLEQFYKFLGPELKEVTGDPIGVDNLLEEVSGSVIGFKTFNECFDEKHRRAWDKEMLQFREKTVEIEDKAIVFLDTRFRKVTPVWDGEQSWGGVDVVTARGDALVFYWQMCYICCQARLAQSVERKALNLVVVGSSPTLRSAEGAFQLLQNFKSIQSRDRINDKMKEKFADIVVQYGNEVKKMTEVFQRHKNHPRIAKNAPPVSGAIAWARNILERVKRPIMAFRSMQSLLDSPTGQQACGEYIELGKAILKYEKELFAEWQRSAEDKATECLGRSILAIDKCEGDASSSTYVVNFAPELIELMKEARNFDLIGGFEVPGGVLNLALQMDKYKDYAEQLRVMLQSYEEAIGGLSMVQCKILHTQIRDLHKCLRPGLTPLNWNSLGIIDFIESASRGIAAFKNVREQVEKSEERIEAVVESIERSILVRPFDWTKTDISPSASTSTLAEESVGSSSSDVSKTMDVMEFYDFFETHRVAEVEKLVDQYEAIGPFLIKIEETTAGTKSGAAESMREYYVYWERRIFNAITTALVRGISTFQVLLDSATERPPLIKIRAEFNPPEVVVGSLHGVFKLLTKLLQNVLHSAGSFVRWMDGTCLMVPTQSAQLEEDKALAFTFYKDVSENPVLVEMTMTIQNSVQQVFQIINKFMRSWKKYDTQWGLWDVKRRQNLERLAVDKKPSLHYFDAHLRVYRNLIDTMVAYKRDHDVAFVRVDCSAVINGIRSQAQEWMTDYARILGDIASKELEKIRTELKDYRSNIDFMPTKLEELKSMLNTITTVEAVNMDMEIRIGEVRENYRTLLLYKCKMKPEDMNYAESLPEVWRSLKKYSRAKDEALEKSKIEFAEITKQEVVDFSDRCSKLLDEFSSGGPGTDDVSLEEGAELMKKYQNEVNQCQNRKEELVKSEMLFNLPITSYVELVIVEKHLKLLKNVYDIYMEHRKMVEEFSNMLWCKIDIALLERTSEEYDKKVRKKGKELPDLKSTSVFKKLEQVVSDFKNSVPLIASLKTDAIKPGHWGELMALAGQAAEEDSPLIDLASMTLKSVFALELQRFPEEVNEIRTAATNEMNIENELKRIEAAWRALNLDMGMYKGDRGHVLRGNEELRQTLEDHVLLLQSMSMSKYAVKLMESIKRWEKNLNVVNEVLSAWLTVQRKWMYLESIFLDSDDIRMQLPEEAKKFDKIHKVFKELMEKTASSPNAIQACCANDRLTDLKNLTAELDRTQKSLTDYLDTKRASFPRFYFISDDELLSILGSSDPQAVQPHSLKLFDNAKEIVFKPGTANVIGMVSDEGERWTFCNTVKAVGAVEDWMNKVDDEMKDSLLRLMKEAVYHYPSSERTQWILSRLGMVVLAGTQIWWTWSIEDTFKRVMEKGDKNAMKKELRKETQQLNQLVELIRTDLSSCNRKCVNTLIILDVHARDIVDRFVRDSILDAREFAWESQLRFMWDRKLDDILIKQCTGSFRYCYEYQGLNGRLVITPLTDRCVMTLTTALTFLLGGSPAGPAGTGKTETVKDLAKSLAIRCVVFNCGEGLDFKAMGGGERSLAKVILAKNVAFQTANRNISVLVVKCQCTIFSGLAEAGFWGCFDEFNRINAEVLSVVSAQIKSIQMGLAQQSKTIELLGRDVTLRSTIGYFITMNPGYAGRTELPDNLKAMFRPVVMIVPDLLMICENMLMSEGFGKAKVLANKMTVLYSLAQGQLSKQYHYDFKLRALKSVLVMAGDLKRSSSELPEDVVLMRALRDMNMPKFVKEDWNYWATTALTHLGAELPIRMPLE